MAAQLRAAGLPAETGQFGADMQVDLVNDGPVTFLVFTAGGAREVHGAFIRKRRRRQAAGEGGARSRAVPSVRQRLVGA